MRAALEQRRELRRQMLHIPQKQPRREKVGAPAAAAVQPQKQPLLFAPRGKLRAELGDCRKAPHIDALLDLLTQQQRQRKPVADGAAPVLHQPQHRFTHPAQRKIKLRVERIRRIDHFLRLLRQEADRLLHAKQQTRRLRAGDGKRDLLRRAVFLQKARMAGADPAKSLLSECLLQLAKSVLRQERAFPVFQPEADVPVLLHKSVFQPLSQRTRHRLIEFHRLRVHNDLPVLAAGIRAVTRKAAELRVEIRVDLFHDIHLLYGVFHDCIALRPIRQYCYFRLAMLY